ncbi:hypothetical protein PENTCL1PPCAC_30304, partial [Pristionchus entomophagus]
ISLEANGKGKKKTNGSQKQVSVSNGKKNETATVKSRGMVTRGHNKQSTQKKDDSGDGIDGKANVNESMERLDEATEPANVTTETPKKKRGRRSKTETTQRTSIQ